MQFCISFLSSSTLHTLHLYQKQHILKLPNYQAIYFNTALVFALFIASTCLSTSKAQNLQLVITGQNPEETSIIDSIAYQHEHHSIGSMQKSLKKLSHNLQKIGFINNWHSKLTKINDSIYKSEFTLHKKYNYISISYPELTDSLFLKNYLNTHRIPHNNTSFKLSLQELTQQLNKLNTALAAKGYPFSQLQLTDIRVDSAQLYADLKLHKRKQRFIDSIIIKGYPNFPRSFLRYYVNLKPKQVFNQEEIKQKGKLLNSLHFITTVRDPQVRFTDRKTQLYLYLKKQPANSFEGFLGFSTDEDSHQLKLNGDIAISLVNNLNFGETLNIHYQNTQTSQREFSAELSLPFLFNTPFSVQAGLNLFKQDSSFTTNTQRFSLGYQLTPQINLAIGYKGVTSTNLLEDSFITSQIFTDYKANFITLETQYKKYSTNQSPLFPIQTDIELSFGLGKRSTDTIADQQTLIALKGQHLINLDTRNSIYLHTDAAILISNHYLNNELYRFGGINSIRGFNENSLLASTYASLQTEYRYLLSSNLYIHSIIDYAYSENSLQNSSYSLYSVGFGLGLQTKAGLLRLAFANGKTPEQSFKFSNTKVHLSLSTRF